MYSWTDTCDSEHNAKLSQLFIDSLAITTCLLTSLYGFSNIVVIVWHSSTHLLSVDHLALFSKQRDSTMSKVNKFFSGLMTKKKKDSDSSADDDMEIGLPTNIKHEIHVTFDPETGNFKSLPGPWEMWLQGSNIRYLVNACVDVLAVQQEQGFLVFHPSPSRKTLLGNLFIVSWEPLLPLYSLGFGTEEERTSIPSTNAAGAF